ncbi:MAG: AEC family transporter [Oscillospiraceae bacterium]|nr:AEC family transporter [Oscillospiraceae bacterium]
MLEYMIRSLNTTVPFILLAGLGIVLRRLGMIDEKFAAKGNKVIFYSGIPVVIFNTIRRANLSNVFDTQFLVFNIALMVVIFLAVWLLAVKLMREKDSVSSFVNSAYRSSLSVVAPPLFMLMFEQYHDPDVLPKSILVVSVLLIVSYATASVLFAVHDPKPNQKGVGKAILNVIISVAKNPVVIGVILGIIFNVLGLGLSDTVVGQDALGANVYGDMLPTFLATTLDRLGGIVMPLAMICVGANLKFHGFDAKFKYVIIASVFKLLLMPVVAVAIALAFGFRGSDLTIIMILNALPMAVGAYVMQAELGGDTYIGGSVLMITMTFSALTLTLFIFLFRVMGFLT